MEVKTARNLGVAVGLALLLAAVGILTPGTALANGCNLTGNNQQVDRILTGIINENLVIEDRVCIGSTDPAVVTKVNGNILIKSGGIMKLGGFERPASVDGNVTVESGGFIQIKDRVDGNVTAFGKAKVDLPFQARVHGNVVHHGFPGGCSEKCGKVDFKGGPNQEERVEDSIHDDAAQVFGNVRINGGAILKASGPAEGNFIEGNLVCDDDSKVAGGTEEDWDNKGVDGDLEPAGTHPTFTKVPKGHDHARDGVIEGHYKCAA